MTTQWVDNIDKAVNALQFQIEQLKVKAESNIASPAKLNKLTFPSLCNKTAQSLFKTGSSYYERDPETVEQVDTRLATLKTQMEADKLKLDEEGKANDPLIEINQSIHTKVKQIMKDLGIPNNWSRSYYKTASSRKQTIETNQAGYLGDLSRNIPVSDDRLGLARRIDDQWRAITTYADKLKVDIRAKASEIEKTEKKKKEVLAKARLQVKYGLDENSDWYDVLQALDKKDKYFALARSMEAVRNDWNDGFGPVEWALAKFVVETEEDQEIEADIQSCLDSEEDDGRIFRDTTYNYSFLYGKVDSELMADYQTLQNYYEVY